MVAAPTVLLLKSGVVMPAPLRFSDAPYERSKLERLLRPAIYLSNLTVAAWVYPAWRTARVSWEPDSESLIQLLKKHKRPLICFGWHAYELLMFCAFRGFPRQLLPTAIAHDGFLSRALQQSGTWYGFPVWAYHRKSPVRPRSQVIDMLAHSHKTVGLFTDAGGPDKLVKPGLLEIARETDAQLVPVAVQAKPVIRIPGPRRFLLPVPFAKMTAYHAEPLDGRDCTLEECQQALDDLERRIEQSPR